MESLLFFVKLGLQRFSTPISASVRFVAGCHRSLLTFHNDESAPHLCQTFVCTPSTIPGPETATCYVAPLANSRSSPAPAPREGEGQTGVGKRVYIVRQSFLRCSGPSIVEVCADTIKSSISRMFYGKFHMTGQDDAVKVGEGSNSTSKSVVSLFILPSAG